MKTKSERETILLRNKIAMPSSHPPSHGSSPMLALTTTVYFGLHLGMRKVCLDFGIFLASVPRRRECNARQHRTSAPSPDRFLGDNQVAIRFNAGISIDQLKDDRPDTFVRCSGDRPTRTGRTSFKRAQHGRLSSSGAETDRIGSLQFYGTYSASNGWEAHRY